jgi:hypothetical protein
MLTASCSLVPGRYIGPTGGVKVNRILYVSTLVGRQNRSRANSQMSHTNDECLGSPWNRHRLLFHTGFVLLGKQSSIETSTLSGRLWPGLVATFSKRRSALCLGQSAALPSASMQFVWTTTDPEPLAARTRPPQRSMSQMHLGRPLPRSITVPRCGSSGAFIGLFSFFAENASFCSG